MLRAPVWRPFFMSMRCTWDCGERAAAACLALRERRLLRGIRVLLANARGKGNVTLISHHAALHNRRCGLGEKSGA